MPAGTKLVFSVDDYADDIEAPSFRLRMKCGGRNVDVLPNWKEQPRSPSLVGKQ
jgi:hypothetical protein